MIEKFVFLLYIISFAIGAASFSFALLYYIQERVSWFIYYLVFLFAFGILLIFDQFFIIDNSYGRIFDILFKFAIILAMSLLLYIMPIFLFHVIKFGHRTFKIILATTTSSLYFIFSIINMISNIKLFALISIVILFIALTINIIIGSLHLKNIKDKILRHLIFALGILTIIFMPIFAFDIISIFINFNIQSSVSNITISFFYLWWNAIMLGYFFWYFIRTLGNRNVLQTSTTAKKSNLSEKGFVLTKRENEIVGHILKGRSNKDIANALHISLNTVNNHVANIYEKTNVKNRVELVNVIKE